MTVSAPNHTVPTLFVYILLKMFTSYLDSIKYERKTEILFSKMNIFGIIFKCNLLFLLYI